MDRSARDTTLSQDIGSYLRYQLRGRRGLIAAAILLAVPALWLGWPWLVAAGLAPLILAVAPCAIMCGLGLCMNRACKTSGTGASASAKRADSHSQSVSAPQESGFSLSHDWARADGGRPSETRVPPDGTANLPTQTKETIQ